MVEVVSEKPVAYRSLGRNGAYGRMSARGGHKGIEPGIGVAEDAHAAVMALQLAQKPLDGVIRVTALVNGAGTLVGDIGADIDKLSLAAPASAHILKDEEKLALLDNQAKLETDKKELETKVRLNEERLALVGTIEKCRKDIAAALQALELLEKAMQEEAYKADAALVHGWDNTTSQRQAWTKMKDAQEKREKTHMEEPARHAAFQRLAADLAQRDNDIRLLNKHIEDLRQWLDKHKDWEGIYGKAGEIIQKIRQYDEVRKGLQSLSCKIQAEALKTSVLKDEAERTTRQAGLAAKAVAEKQKAIDGLNRQREELNPVSVNRQLDTANNMYAQLSQLRQTLQTIGSDADGLEKLGLEVKQQEETLAALQKTTAEAETAYKLARERDEKANNLLYTASAQAHMGGSSRAFMMMGGRAARYQRGILAVSQAAMAVARVPTTMSMGP